MRVADPTHAEPHAVVSQRRLLVTERDGSGFYRPVGFLSADHVDGTTVYGFDYLRSAVARPGFRPFLGFSDVTRPYRSAGLFPLFAERLMDPRRPDHPMFLAALDLTGEVGPFEVLARSGGQRVGDGVFLLPVPEVAADGGTECVFLVSGMRHVDGADAAASGLVTGERLVLQPEPTNSMNNRALLVAERGGARLGWVPDALLEYVHSVHDRHLTVVRVNGPNVGVRLRLLVRLSGRADPSHQPFSGPAWATVNGD